MRRNKKATTKHFSSSIWRCAVTGVVEHSWIHLLRSSPAMRRTLSAGNSPANARGRAGRPARPAGLEVGADLGEDSSECFDSLAIKDAVAAFGDKKQKEVDCRRGKPAVSKVL